MPDGIIRQKITGRPVSRAPYDGKSKNTAFGLNVIDPSIMVDVQNNPKLYDRYKRWLQLGMQGDTENLRYNSFSGADVKAAIWIPPSRHRASGSYKLWAQLQTVTISSERPAGPVRVLGSAIPRDYIRGVRTIAGSMIFTVLDKDVFSDVLQPTDRESAESYPIYVDQIPPFHLLITAQNEMGYEASAAVMGCTLTNFGTTYSIDDLLLESTYTYVARYVTPFMNKRNWRAGLAAAVSRMEGNNLDKASRHRVLNEMRDRQGGQFYDDQADLEDEFMTLDTR